MNRSFHNGYNDSDPVRSAEIGGVERTPQDGGEPAGSGEQEPVAIPLPRPGS